MNKLILPALAILILTVPSGRICSCRIASGDDIPHGANEDIEYAERTVKNISGLVRYALVEGTIGDVVVEIYDVAYVDRKLRPRQIVGLRTRRAACVTATDGKFCFPNLPSGKYVLRAGTRSFNGGMNEVYMRVNVDRRWWTGWLRRSKPITLGLSPGT
jgi:hypothetical protein